MTQVIKRRNGDGAFPFLRNDFLTNRSFTSDLFDFDDAFFNGRMNVPPVNIAETQDQFRLELSVPGMKKDDFKVDIEDGILTISSEKEEERIENTKEYKRKEFSYSSFSRSFTLPDNADENNINAKYDNGMLQVSINKKEVTVSKPKKQIKVS